MDLNIRESDILQAIEKLKLNKVLGPDGFIDEFYKRFKHVLALKLCKLSTSCLASQQIPLSWSHARTVIISKKDRDPSLSESHIPISLLNVDYKILMTVLVARMSSVIGSYVQVQTGFIHNRFLKDNIWKMCNIIDFLMSTCFSFIFLMLKKLSTD